MAIMFDTPYEAVFLKKYGKGNKPLFNNQIDLANEIINHPESGFQDKNAMTIRSAISQIFTGERNLSKNLKYVLIIAIKARFDNKKYDYEQFEKFLFEKLRTTYEERMFNKRERQGDIDFDNLMAATKSGKEFLITTLEPAELHKSELANRLKNELLEKTGIVESSDAIKRAKYKFYLPDKNGGRIAREFWEELRAHAIERYNVTPLQVDKKLKSANQKGIILTFLVPTHIAMHPYVFINYTNRLTVTGFCVSYRNKEIPSVAELSLKVVYAWLEEYSQSLKTIEKLKGSPFPYELNKKNA